MSGWRTERDPWFGCQLWRGSINSVGYPTYWGGGIPRQAYLVAWERVHGPVPASKELDHLCRRRLCVAVPHFEVVSRNENIRRVRWEYRSQLEQCSQGHQYTTHGRRTPEAGMICRICSGVWTPSVEPELE